MTRRQFHILVALILLVCVVCPYVEAGLDWNEGVITTGYDTESIVAILALLLTLSLMLAKLMAVFLPAQITDEPVVASRSSQSRHHSFVFGVLEVFPPLPLRI
jgi:hypothetical protein